MISAALDHLWQSTVILCVAGVLTLTMRNNGAHVRYGLWFAASLKFLIPLSLLGDLAGRFPRLSSVSPLAGPESELLHRVSQPFVQGLLLSDASGTAPATSASALHYSTILLILWGAGCAAVMVAWFLRWHAIQRTLLSARPLALDAPIPVRESATLMEPGLVGIRAPVIFLPSGLADRLTATEIRSILDHEICHFRRRDNLTSAIHMLVEALFWFYPPVWWLGARLIAERERACDESVVAAGNDPKAYAQGILKVCRLFTHRTIACTAGVSGGGLRHRVEQIMSAQSMSPVGHAKKWLVALSLGGVLVGMTLFGGLAAPLAQAQAPVLPSPATTERAALLAEERQPQQEVSFNPAEFSKLEGYYQYREGAAFFRIFRAQSHYFGQITGQPAVEIFPESPTKFFATVVPAQISFDIGADGRVTQLVLHQNGYNRPWARSTQAANDAADAALQQRLKGNQPSPGAEAAIHRQIESFERTSEALYAEMSPELAEFAHDQSAQSAALFKRLGAFESLRFYKVLPNGRDDYLATFASGKLEVTISPLSPDGKVLGLFYHDEP